MTHAANERVSFLTTRGLAIAFAEALDEANGRAGEIEFGAQLVFEEPFVAEVQRSFLIGENEESRRRGFRLRDVVDTHGTRLGRGAALEIDVLLQPVV